MRHEGKTWDVRHEGKSKLMPQMRNSHTRARELVKKFIADLYDIGFLRSPGFLRLHVGSRWDQKGEDCRRLESLGSFCIVGFFPVATNNRLRSKEAHLRFVCTRASQTDAQDTVWLTAPAHMHTHIYTRLRPAPPHRLPHKEKEGACIPGPVVEYPGLVARRDPRAGHALSYHQAPCRECEGSPA